MRTSSPADLGAIRTSTEGGGCVIRLHTGSDSLGFANSSDCGWNNDLFKQSRENIDVLYQQQIINWSRLGNNDFFGDLNRRHPEIVVIDWSRRDGPEFKKILGRDTQDFLPEPQRP